MLATFEPDGMLLVRSVSSGNGILVDSYAVALLATCSAPRSRDEVVDVLGEPAGELFDQLEAVGLLLPPEQVENTPVLFGNFAGIEAHRRRLADEVRLEAYRQALEVTLQPGDVVIDAGAGSGALSVLAARAGAARVYAIERTELAMVARQVALDSGVGEQVVVLQDDFRQVVLPEPASVLVTETFGAWALAEAAAPDLRACAERNLLPGGITIPHSISLWLAPMRRAPLDLLRPFRQRPDGIDLTCLREDARGQSANRLIRPEQLGAPVQLGTFPLTWDLDHEVLEAEIEVQGPCEALCGWFVLHLAPGVDLSTSPLDPPTHWQQTVLPVELPRGSHRLRLELTLAPEDRRTLVVEISGAVRQSVRVR